MAYSLSPLLKPRFFVNATNKPLVGGKLYTYLAETTTPATTYSNDTGTPNTNPIILDANGECNLYLDDDVSYRLILKDANDVTYFDKDRVSSIGGGDYKVLTFNTIADLRLKIGSTKEPVAQTSGYYAAGDGGGNRFYWDGTSGATDNGGTVIKPTFVSGAGRWLAIESKKANVLQFGARGNNNADDYQFIQSALDAVGSFGVLIFPKTSTNIFLTSAELFFYEGQLIEGIGGTSVVTNNGTQIKLTATASGVMSPISKATTKYSGTIRSIYFNAQGFGDYGLSLYNCSYFNIEHCSATSTKANGCGLLLDSNVSLQCYFNIIRGGRFFATGTGGAAIRFTRGANANTVIGGKCGSSYCGMDFLQSSSGNIIIGTDFEDNSYCHIYADSPSNIFNSLHMESCPTGYLLTSNATNTSRIATSFASTVTTQVNDSSKTGSVLDTRIDTISTKGDLRFGAAKFISNLLSSTTTLDYDPDLVSSTSNADFRFFLNTNTSGLKRILFYKGDGTNTLNLILASTGEITCNDLTQEAGVGAGLYRKICHRAAAPTTGTWSRGDKVFFTNPSAGGYIGAVCTVSGTPGTWNNFGLIV